MNERPFNRIYTKVKNSFNRLVQFIPFFNSRSRLKNAIIKQHDLTDCGATCIASISAYYNLTIPVARIRQYASTDKKGTNVLGLIEAATKLGFNAKGVKADFEQLPHVPVPVIAHVIIKQVLHHYVVVYHVTDTTVEIMDPARGELMTMGYDEFKRIWTGVLILVQPGDTFIDGNEKISVKKRFWYLLKPHKSILLQVLMGAIIYTVLGLSTSIFLQKIVDNVLPEGNRNLLNLMGVVMIGILLFRVVINHAKSLLTIKTGQQIDARLILGYYKHLLRLPQQFFDNMRVGEIISRMNDAVKIRVFVNDVLIGFAVNMFILVFSFVLMFTYYWKLALIMMGVVPLYAIIYYFSNKMNRSTQRKLMESSAELESQLVESIHAVSTIKRFGLEDFTNMRTETRFVGMLRSVYESNTNSLWIGDFSGFVSSAFTIILLWAGSLFVLNNIITPGELLSFYAIIGYFTGPVSSLIGMNKTIQDASIAADRLFEIMDIERESVENKAVLTPDMIGDIHFRNVHFRYGTRVTVFEGLNLMIPKGKITAVVGESGSGKTTLLSLLQNIYPIENGNIQLGGFDIKYLTNDSLRQMVSAVPQDVHLFAGNVINNIAVGEFEPDMKKIVSICQELDIMKFIENLPNGFNTYIGENGTSLSGGQRQRLAIARALYRDPEILILDEATSSLDSKSEQHIQLAVQSLRKKNKTIIIIAHRLSTVMSAEKIVVLEKGTLIEEGSHKKLLSKKGKYYEMWKQQFPALEESVN
ncbi:peptidase domain-containing ABC transporter [Dyadobacter sp. CY347]|uniref:peptidase domain-containing ABC transporter n=1 Tax=Dyadobacter sp. CY347 TaxID=2909336 RepID=UPI001F1C75D7|nr:peptidase domain-containing ABC transporter [Dyadobacter sp. CY347]MCF2488352.1 peptidase domain-containing ABC transporter [Dyadobacter sp. CY347]